MFATLSTSLAFPGPRRSTRFAALLVVFAWLAHPLAAAEVHLTTENDLLSDHHTPDDLNTFSMALDTRRGLHSISLRENAVALRPGLELAPLVEIDSAPGFRSLGLAAVRADWKPTATVAVHAMLGARFADASYDPLEPHLARTASAARVGVTVAERYYLSWSYNDHGERRGHLTVGYRLGGHRGGDPAGR